MRQRKSDLFVHNRSVPAAEQDELMQSRVKYGSRSKIVGTSTLMILLGSFFLLVLAFYEMLSITPRGSTTEEPHHHKLRFDWSDMPVSTDLGKQILAHQTNCSLPLGLKRNLNSYGLGSSLHSWSWKLQYAMRDHYRTWTGMSVWFVDTTNGFERKTSPWIWRDEEACDSPLLCYFPGVELQCPGDIPPVNGTLDSKLAPGKIDADSSSFRAATTEFMFRKVSQVVIDEAERQLNLVFPDSVPSDLIVVHIRWGDKKGEMPPPPIGEYVDGILKIMAQRQQLDTTHANIFLATEDPQAVEEFRQATPKGWNVYLDQYFHYTVELRKDDNSTKNKWEPNNRYARASKGHSGLIALGSLLLSMEANDFVLTTKSNWSRLMNELRKNVVDPRCNECTLMVDLRPGED